MTVGLYRAPAPGAELGQLLLDAKFSVPRPRPAAVSRAGLVEAARSSGRRLVAVTAPAGYGKSTFLAQWAQVEDRRVAWVSLDRFDDDPAMLLVSLASAYCRAGMGRAGLIADMRGLGMSVLGRAAPLLASALRTSPVRFVLMLDDLHELQSPACHDVFGMLIAAIPVGSQLAAASRSEQPHLPWLRASGQALGFGAANLALDAAGARQIFANVQVSLTPEQATAVTERTEGWPVGLNLAALIATKSHGQDRAVTGDDRYVADYPARRVPAPAGGGRAAVTAPHGGARSARAVRCAMPCWGLRVRPGSCGAWRPPACSWSRWIAGGSGTGTTGCSGSSCSPSSAAPNRPHHDAAPAGRRLV